MVIQEMMLVVMTVHPNLNQEFPILTTLKQKAGVEVEVEEEGVPKVMVVMKVMEKKMVTRMRMTMID